MPDVTAVPLCRPQHRGVINLRGRIIPLIDLRKQFGWQSVPEELQDFFALMRQREQDHRNWIDELERSVVEGSEFRLATDPHQCAFGRWYDSYRSTSPWITALLRTFEKPHGQIHALASEVGERIRNGNSQEAKMRIGQARNGVLRQMIAIFQEFKELMRDTVKELAVVIMVGRNAFAVSADRAVAVENIAPDRIKDVGTGLLAPGSQLVHRCAERSAARSLAMILEPDLLVSAADLGTTPRGVSPPG